MIHFDFSANLYGCLLSLILLVLPTGAAISGQKPDILIIDGKSHKIWIFPLETLYTLDEINELLLSDFELMVQILPSDGKFTEDKKLNKILISDPLRQCTNQRGYLAEWALVNDQLMLNSIDTGICMADIKVEPGLFFDDLSYPVKANWFSGVIEVRLSKDIQSTFIIENDLKRQVGYSYQIMRYEFFFGDLIYKSREVVRVEWD